MSSILVTIRITARIQESEVRNPDSLDYGLCWRSAEVCTLWVLLDVKNVLGILGEYSPLCTLATLMNKPLNRWRRRQHRRGCANWVNFGGKTFFAGKIYVLFYKIPEFYIIIARKIFFPDFGRARAALRLTAPSLPSFPSHKPRRRSSVNFRGHDIFARKICMKN